MIARGPLILLATGCVAATAVGFLLGQGRTVALAAGLALAQPLSTAAAGAGAWLSELLSGTSTSRPRS